MSASHPDASSSLSCQTKAAHTQVPSTCCRHNPSNLAAIRILRKTLATDIPHVAVFDTSFHSTIPEKAYTYPLPKEYRDAHMRKFGFHGTSVRYVVTKATQVLLERTNPNRSDHDDDDFRIIVCHLGSGASVTAVVGNKVQSISSENATQLVVLVHSRFFSFCVFFYVAER